VAPEVFALDESELGGRRKGTEPLGVRDVEAESIDSETIVRAATSCPYRAITIRNTATGEQLCP
jgi:ferredoxin